MKTLITILLISILCFSGLSQSKRDIKGIWLTSDSTLRKISFTKSEGQLIFHSEKAYSDPCCGGFDDFNIPVVINKDTWYLTDIYKQDTLYYIKLTLNDNSLVFTNLMADNKNQSNSWTYTRPPNIAQLKKDIRRANRKVYRAHKRSLARQ